jgi:PhoPQ-activated pathogenicity-related protein
LNVFWDGLQGPKWIVYVPDAGHSLAENRNYATTSLAAFFRHMVSGRPMPQLSWTHSDADGGARLRLQVRSTPPPKSAELWVATSDSLDFRDARWKSSPVRVTDSSLRGEVARPDKGCIALFGALAYEIDGIRYHLSTQVRQTTSAQPAK